MSKHMDIQPAWPGISTRVKTATVSMVQYSRVAVTCVSFARPYRSAGRRTKNIQPQNDRGKDRPAQRPPD
ncbi:hypothetical protein MES4922_370002 [Mesorhizobium ventifaucium]|uniref:Uncharacterized protein n=1 Tax=Mesorhizobium ventifaucium TaxID=666020 RepID=A0ABM9E6G6_9HYPH|nr:hypothetical protein MES4922_370002 [Mesorhizobium ventifaucium]